MSRIHLISGPRNISTALMYSFGNRADMSIVDEPYYAYYLDKHPTLEHPGRKKTLASQSRDMRKIQETVMNASYPTPHVFFKNMAQHMDGLDWNQIKTMKNIFLIRDPAQLIASFAQVIPEPTMLDIGLELEWKIYDHAQNLGADTVIVDSNDILSNPKDMLARLCDAVGIDFSERMLQWEAGARTEDGVWAEYWYANVHQSTSFQRQKTSSRPFPEKLQPLLKQAQVYYDKLYAFALR